MKAKRTPGPWTIEHPGHLVSNTPVIESATGRVAMVRREEDADVISAAPDMLEALEETLSWIVDSFTDEEDQPQGIVSRAQAAIAKAKGGAA